MTCSPLQGVTLDELGDFFAQHEISRHQARLVFRGIHRGAAAHPSPYPLPQEEREYNSPPLHELPEISASCRKFLKTLPPLPALTVDAVHAADDGTVKLRLKTPTGEAIEAVIIPAKARITLCVSSQVGCAAGCTFCHTGTMGLLRNLEAWEIVEQYRAARAFAPGRITNLVFMGMGEPLHNEANVLQACRILNDDNGAGFSRRHIVVSTAGVGNRIRPLWESNVASLAVSLHATTDEVRGKIVPLNTQCNLGELRNILLSIPWRHRETVTIAYLLLDGVNDSREDAERLSEWCRGLPVKINLLEFNPYPGSTFKRSPPERLAAFRQWLNDFGLFNTLRHSRGEDAMAACGQLATEGKSKRTVNRR